MITIGSNGLSELIQRGTWFPPSKGKLDDLIWVGFILAATVVLVPVLLGLKIRALVVSRPHHSRVKK